MPPPSPAGFDEAAEFAEFARAFPFHLVISPQLTLLGMGGGIARLDPELCAGARLDAHFLLREPAGELGWTLLAATPDADFCLVHRRSSLELRGRMVLARAGGPAIFLGSSWLDDAEQLADFGIATDQLLPPEAAAPAIAGPPTREIDLPADPQALAAHCRRLERSLRLSQSVSRVLADSQDAPGALAQLVASLPAALGWPSATLWRKDSAGEPKAEHAFPEGRSDDATAELARRVFRSGAPIWSADGCDGCGGFAIPANTDAGTIAVVVCRSDRAEPADDALAHQLYLSAGQLARFLARQQQKERLTRLTSELSAIFQLSADGFVAFNGDGVLSYLNPAFARMTGLERDDLRGLDQAGFERRLDGLRDPKQAEERAGNGDRVIHLAQPRRTVLQRSQRDARDLDGRLVGRLFYFRDITLETGLLRANGEFLSNAAHELQTPMASIHGFVELLLKTELPAEKRRTVLETVLRQSTRLIEIVKELLEVARFDARAARDLDRRPQALAPVIRATVDELLVHDDPRRVELALPDDDASPWGDIDRDRFTQALTNVLSNAYKYSPNGGEITLRLVERTRSDLRWVGVAVRDRGIGMSAEEQRRLFDRFFRAHPSGAIPGTGLGMSLIKKIVDAHGGSVEVDSAPGAGTEVTLWLPRIEPPA